MIDINKAQKFYKEYIKKYNPENPKIKLKISHILRVSSKAKDLAIALNLSKEDIELAELIGLLHDIGRFEQIKQYNTFNDRESINHGEYGAKILFEDGLINKFIDDRQYDSIIYKAIINHNRDNIEKGLDKRTLLHCKIIRDADILDILYILTTENIETIYNNSNILTNEITPIIYNQYIHNHKINYASRKNTEDILVSHMAYIFQISYKYTLKEIKKNDYITKLINRFEFKNQKLQEQINILYKISTEYINNK